ncbi:hypothetical protein AB1E19_013777 [Capra hircus]
MSMEAEEKEEIIASIPEGVYDQPIPVALTLPENLLIITLTLADCRQAIHQGLLPAALLAAGGGLHVGRDPTAAGPLPHGTRDCPPSRMLRPDGARLHPGPRGAPAAAGMPADRCLATPPRVVPSAPYTCASARSSDPAAGRAASSSSLGPSPGCPLPVCGPSILDHSLCNSTPLLERACAATRPLPLASFLVAVCTLAGPVAGPGLSYSSASLAQACTCLPRGAAFSTHSSQVLVVSLTSASCSASPASPLLCAPEPQADHVA